MDSYHEFLRSAVKTCAAELTWFGPTVLRSVPEASVVTNV
jgi:hypothetical protein